MSNLKEQWIEALRSEKYSQGHGMLRDLADNFCCLGVLCDIKDPSKWEDLGIDEDEEGDDGYFGPFGTYLEDDSYAPDDLINEVFEGEQLATNPYPEGRYSVQEWLSELNDSGKYTFKDIADLIEQGPKKIEEEVRNQK